MRTKPQIIIDLEKAAAVSANNIVENLSSLVERDKPVSYYALINLEIYNKKFAEREKEKIKAADVIKYSIN
jgi:hypothetical protein